MFKSNVENIGKWSNNIIQVICDCCGAEKSIKFKLYTSYGYRDGEYLCRKCKLKENNLKNWGVENVFQSPEIKIKIKKRIKDIWGVENISQSQIIKDKIVNNNLLKYGETHHMKKKEILQKQTKTCRNIWGVKNISQVELIKDKKRTNYKNKSSNEKSMINNKRKQTNISKYRYYNFYPNSRKLFKISNHKDYIEYRGDKIHEFSCKHGHNFSIHTDIFYSRLKSGLPLCTICNQVNSFHISGAEKQILDFIKENYTGNIITSDKNILGGKEIDIYLPDIKLAIEFNGLFYHSINYKPIDYHLDKTMKCADKGIELIHIWEDDWSIKPNVVKSIILNKLKKFNTENFDKVISISASITEKFIEENSLDEYSPSVIKKGIYKNDELIAIICIKKVKNNYHLTGIYNKLFTIVNYISELKKIMITYKIQQLLYRSNSDNPEHYLLQELGFKKIGYSEPSPIKHIQGVKVYNSGFTNYIFQIER